jgi:hypothetical protein
LSVEFEEKLVEAEEQIKYLEGKYEKDITYLAKV